ncbi:hypothetical protein NGRA_3215, partial [Nosema granulosis]
MKWIILIVLDIVMCPRTSSTSSYIINTPANGRNEDLNVQLIGAPLYFISQNPTDCSSYYQNVLNYQQHSIYNYQRYGTYNYSQDHHIFYPQYGIYNNAPQIEQSSAHNNTQFTFRNEADDSSIIDVVGIDDHHQASNSKKEPEFSNLKKRKLKDETITSPDGIKKQRTVTEYANSINSVCNGLNCKKQNHTKILKKKSFLKMIENYNLPNLSTQINIDLLRLSQNVDDITNTTNSQTDDKAIYVEVFKRIVRTVKFLFLSKVNEKKQNSQNVIFSKPKTAFDIFNIDFLRKETLELKQDEKIIPSGEIAMLESKLKHSLVIPRIRFYDNLKRVALLIYNNNNFDVTIIIKNLLYEMRILKYEVREMRSVIL